MTIASIFESGAVYYPLILLLPIATGLALARWRPHRRALWILAAVVTAFILFDFALDDTRSEDVAFFVVLGLFMFGLGLLARLVARRVVRPAASA
jgi:peptidoglycan/LPS O-acetylase OafA/YrhL